jgi:hypothetical protein
MTLFKAAVARVFVLLTAFSFLLSCGRDVEVAHETNNTGNVFICNYPDAQGLFVVASHTQDKLLFRRKPVSNEIEDAAAKAESGDFKPKAGDNFLGTKAVSGSLDLYYLKDGKRDLCLQNFAALDPIYSQGIIDSAPGALLKADQNLGRMGLLLPLYKAGFEKTDWAVYNTSDKKLYTLGGPGTPAKTMELPLNQDGKGGLYRGEREYAITSPSWPFAATLSHEGKMALFSWPDGKKIYEGAGVYSFCFHPALKILYFGSKDGLNALVLDKNGNARTVRLQKSPVRMIRISSKGSYLFCLGTGGIIKPAIIALNRNGLYLEEPLELGKKYGEAKDWVWLDDKTLLLVFRYPQSAFLWELNVRKGEYYETILDPKLQDVAVISANVCPSVLETRLYPEDQARPADIMFFHPRSGRFEPVKGLPEKSVIPPGLS